jgi:hypothetical protein
MSTTDGSGTNYLVLFWTIYILIQCHCSENGNQNSNWFLFAISEQLKYVWNLKDSYLWFRFCYLMALNIFSILMPKHKIKIIGSLIINLLARIFQSLGNWTDRYTQKCEINKASLNKKKSFCKKKIFNNKKKSNIRIGSSCLATTCRALLVSIIENNFLIQTKKIYKWKESKSFVRAIEIYLNVNHKTEKRTIFGKVLH